MTYKTQLSQLLTEFLGTFFLVLTVVLSDGEGFVIGPCLMVLVYMGGHLSGAHYNPAVTLGVTLRGACDRKMAVYYVIVQFIAALMAGTIGDSLMRREGYVLLSPSPGPGYNVLQAFFAETMHTFLLLLVVLNVATAKKTDKNSYFGLAIGVTVLVGVKTIGPISGGVFNPAVGFGLIVNALWYQSQTLRYLWIYLTAPFLGAFFGFVTFKLQHPLEFDLTATDPEMGSMPREDSNARREPLLLDSGAGAINSDDS